METTREGLCRGEPHYPWLAQVSRHEHLMLNRLLQASQKITSNFSICSKHFEIHLDITIILNLFFSRLSAGQSHKSKLVPMRMFWRRRTG